MVIRAETRWPRPEFDPALEPHFLFIVTPPYSGSTALCRLLNTSPRSMLLYPSGEGQRLVPGMKESDRWDADKEVDYASVRAVWLGRFQEIRRLTQTTDLVIEKSPPNMVRLDEIAGMFRSCSFLANNRDPYANCASFLGRQHDVEKLAAPRRAAALSEYAAGWLERSRIIRRLVDERAIPYLSYEDFCADPAQLLQRLPEPAGFAESIDLDAEVQVKDYQPQRIVNQNPRQIGLLTSEDIRGISDVLARDEAIVDHFGYSLLPAA